VTVNDKDGELISASGKNIKHGSFDFKISPLVTHETASKVFVIGVLIFSIFIIAVIITFVLAVCRSSLISTWLCINTL